jgi:zinc/manganese transport system substrate-binding protein
MKVLSGSFSGAAILRLECYSVTFSLLKEMIMISRRILLISAFASLATLATPAMAQTGKLPVVASFSILGDIIQTIGGDRIALTTLVKSGSDAHVFAPTPADAKLVWDAKLIISNGLKFEGWMKRLVQSSQSKATLVEASSGIKGRKAKKEAHSHGHSHDHGSVDPHAWQAVDHVKIYVVNIRDALIKADEPGKSVYEANAARYLSELDVLDRDIKMAVAKIPEDKRKIISSHDAFGYFQDAYGLQFIAPRGISTETEASAKDVARIIQQIKREKITAVFLEKISDPRLIQQIAAESGAKIGGILFSDSLSAADGPAPSYILMMRHNIKTISEALTPKV